MNGAADYAVAVIAVAVLLWLGWKAVFKTADRLIDSIDWLTRHEKK